MSATTRLDCQGRWRTESQVVGWTRESEVHRDRDLTTMKMAGRRMDRWANTADGTYLDLVAGDARVEVVCSWKSSTFSSSAAETPLKAGEEVGAVTQDGGKEEGEQTSAIAGVVFMLLTDRPWSSAARLQARVRIGTRSDSRPARTTRS